jgi:tetratricopeptide (TPR) repeat protein
VIPAGRRLASSGRVGLIGLIGALLFGGTARADRAPTIREALERWDLTGAEAALSGYNGDEALVLKARLDLMRGRFEEVRKRLMPTIDRLDFEARVVLGQALQAAGRREEAFRVLDAMADDYNDDRVTAAEDLTWLGVGLMLTDYPKNAHRVFKEALALEAKDDTKLAQAELYLSKYDYRAANPLFKDVATRHPTHVRAVIGLARVAIESDRAFAEASDLVKPLADKQPECVPCHNVLALIALHNERPEEATRILEKGALEVAPSDPEALALLGAAAYLMDDRAAYRNIEKRALAVDAKNAGFYATVADHAEREHRYIEAIALLEQALRLDPEHAGALSMLGTGYSRTGQDDKARDTLDKAFEADPFNVRTYNLLTHFYDKVDKRFTWVEVAPMRLRVDKGEAPVLARAMPPLLTEAEKSLSRKYGFSPRQPMHIEVFADTQTFAVRSTGLPGLAAHGICFGHVITARSPSAGNFNWAEVLWHELAHVYHIQLARGRVPRWFTEGMAVYESTEGRKSWEREQDRELLAALRGKKLRGVADFNLAFTQARSLGDILVAYYHAYYVAKFIHAAWDFQRARRMLALWGDEKKTPEVFQSALGVSVDEFDRRFFEWLKKELAYLDRAYPFDLEAQDPGLAQATEARTALRGGDPQKALDLAAADKSPLARHVRAHAKLALAKGDKSLIDEARGELEGLRQDGRAGVEDLAALATLAEQGNDLRRAASFLEEAVALDPKDERLRRRVVAAFDKLGLEREAYQARRGLLRVDQMDAALAVKTLELAVKLKVEDRAEVAAVAEQALHIAPFSAEVHLATARALAAMGDKAGARRAAELLLLLAPEHPEGKSILAP